jgi:hypothetical protein
MLGLPRVEYADAIYLVTVRMIGHAWESGRTLDRRVCLFRWSSYRAHIPHIGRSISVRRNTLPGRHLGFVGIFRMCAVSRLQRAKSAKIWWWFLMPWASSSAC